MCRARARFDEGSEKSGMCEARAAQKFLFTKQRGISISKITKSVIRCKKNQKISG